MSNYSLEGLVLKLKLQHFGHLIRRTDSFQKTLMLGKIEGGRLRMEAGPWKPSFPGGIFFLLTQDPIKDK